MTVDARTASERRRQRRVILTAVTAIMDMYDVFADDQTEDAAEATIRLQQGAAVRAYLDDLLVAYGGTTEEGPA